jgi:hypothetical protein
MEFTEDTWFIITPNALTGEILKTWPKKLNEIDKFRFRI